MAFVMRARLPQAEDSAPMHVSRTWGNAPSLPISSKKHSFRAGCKASYVETDLEMKSCFS